MTPTLFDATPENAAYARTASTRYTCPSCPNRVVLHVEHDHAPTCANRHDQRTMTREETR